MGLRKYCIHVLYAAALVGTSVAAFGALGAIPGILIVGAWAGIFYWRSCSRRREHQYFTDPFKPIPLVVFAAVISVLILMILPAVQQSRDTWAPPRCKNNLHQIGLALYNYHSEYNTFPPAYVADENGRPMHSWRVLLLPYLDRTAMYKDYDFDEPWDGPNNRKHLRKMPRLYACPKTTDWRETFASFVAVVGPSTAMEKSAREVTDGLENTILLVECNSERIPWMEPRDLTVEEALQLFTAEDADIAGGHHAPGEFFYEYIGGRHVMLADGSVAFIPHGVDRETWSALLKIDDGSGRPTPIDIRQRWPANGLRLKEETVWLVATFVLLTVLPLPWIWLRPWPSV